MELKKTWQQHSNAFYLTDLSTTVEKLPKGVYTLEVDPKGNIFLQLMSSEFSFGFKVYGLEKDFISRVIKAYNSTNGNLGVLLNGVKGTGKTITGEILANELGLPVILITRNYPHINTFLSSLAQDVIVFIDEYEKVYKGNMGEDWEEDRGGEHSDSSLLSIMDGALKTNYRKVFLLTTNRTWINDNLLNRPGRIRYKKNFADLNNEQIMEILNDCLVETQFKDDIINFLKPLEIITVDIVKSVVSEVNIFKEPPAICCKDFNLEFKSDTYKVIKYAKQDSKKEVIICEDVPLTSYNSFVNEYESHPNSARLPSGTIYLIGVDMTEQEEKKEEETQDEKRYKCYDAHQGTNTAFWVRFEKQRHVHQSLVF